VYTGTSQTANCLKIGGGGDRKEEEEEEEEEEDEDDGTGGGKIRSTSLEWYLSCLKIYRNGGLLVSCVESSIDSLITLEEAL